MLYSDFAFWLYGQPIETQIIVMYLIVFASIGLFLLNYWYEDRLAKRAKNKRIKELSKLFDREKYHII